MAPAETREAAFWIRKTRETYRRVIGVDPSRREDLRRGLQDIRENSRQRVADLIGEIAAHHESQ
jgi:hypothetical protein